MVTTQRSAVWSVVLIMAVLVGAAGFASRFPWLEAPASAIAASPKKAPATACRADADCVLVADDCCPCSAGGRQRAILAKEKEAYERARKDRCADTMCASMMSTDPSCSATKAVCKAGTCALGGPPPPSAGG